MVGKRNRAWSINAAKDLLVYYFGQQNNNYWAVQEAHLTHSVIIDMDFDAATANTHRLANHPNTLINPVTCYEIVDDHHLPQLWKKKRRIRSTSVRSNTDLINLKLPNKFVCWLRHSNSTVTWKQVLYTDYCVLKYSNQYSICITNSILNFGSIGAIQYTYTVRHATMDRKWPESTFGLGRGFASQRICPWPGAEIFYQAWKFYKIIYVCLW